MTKKKYTISVFTEKEASLLPRVTFVFTRRRISMKSVAAHQSEMRGFYKYTFVVIETEETVRKLTEQIQKQVDVHRAVYHQEIDEAKLLIQNEVENLSKINEDLLMVQH